MNKTLVMLVALLLVAFTGCGARTPDSSGTATGAGSSGDVLGRVTDSGGRGVETDFGVVPDPDPGLDQGYSTDINGRFHFIFPVGTYEMTTGRPGLATVTKTVEVTDEDPTRVDFVLEPGD